MISCVFPSGGLVGWLAILGNKNFNVEHFVQTLQPDFFALVTFICTSDLTLVIVWGGGGGGVTRSAQSKTYLPNFSCPIPHHITQTVALNHKIHEASIAVRYFEGCESFSFILC